jgi:hypothetical protein
MCCAQLQSYVTVSFVKIRLQTPIRILPRQKRAIYIHSGLPEDLGIQYQSYPRSDSIVMENEHMVVFPGVGHTVSITTAAMCIYGILY